MPSSLKKTKQREELSEIEHSQHIVGSSIQKKEKTKIHQHQLEVVEKEKKTKKTKKNPISMLVDVAIENELNGKKIVFYLILFLFY